MTSKVRPPSWETRFFTFSNSTALGLCRLTMRATSKNIVPRVSSKPRILPMMLNAWHGKPANSRSCGGMSSSATFVMSPIGLSPKFAS